MCLFPGKYVHATSVHGNCGKAHIAFAIQQCHHMWKDAEMEVVWSLVKEDARKLVDDLGFEELSAGKYKMKDVRGKLGTLKRGDGDFIDFGEWSMPAHVIEKNTIVRDKSKHTFVYIKNAFEEDLRRVITNHFHDILKFPNVHRTSSDFHVQSRIGEQKMVMCGFRRYPYDTGRPLDLYVHAQDNPEVFQDGDIWAQIGFRIAKWFPKASRKQAQVICARLARFGKLPLDHHWGVHNIGISNRYHSPTHVDHDVGPTLACAIKC